MSRTMTLYHFTAPQYVPEIIESGVLKPSDPNLLPIAGNRAEPLRVWVHGEQPHLADAVGGWSDAEIQEQLGGPLVVHLTTEPRDCASVGGVKNLARFVVEVPRTDAHRWLRWARQHGADPSYLRALRSGFRDTHHYHVVPRPIPAKEWIEITDMETYDPLWTR